VSDSTTEGEELARACARLGPREVVLTRGAEGAAVLDPDGTWHEHRPPPARDVDPVGAGDAFNAGYLAARLGGHPPAVALREAGAAGARAAGTLGDVGMFGERARA
jgi:2-dehydro-3-deoxygluconokinase